MENGKFTYSYRAEHRHEVENIRNRYVPKEENKLDQLRRLDKRVKEAGMIESLCVGVVGCLIFGFAMCIGLGAIAGELWLAIIIGLVGVGVMLPAYPVYKRISTSVRAELTPEILKLSDEIMKDGEYAEKISGSDVA